MVRCMIGLVVVVGMTVLAQAAPHVKVASDVESGIYEPGQKVTWTVAVTDKGVPFTGEIFYKVIKSGLSDIADEKVQLQDGKTRIAATRDDPGVLQLAVSIEPFDPQKEPQPQGGVVFAPEKIIAPAPAPDDFDEFWNGKLAELAATPMNVQLEQVDVGDASVEYYQVTLDNIRGRKIRGQLAKPAGQSNLPTMLQFQWSGVYGLEPQWVTGPAKAGWIAMNISVHDLPIDQPKEFYEEHSKTDLDFYSHQGKLDREKNYYLPVFLGCYRAVDYLSQRPDWNKKTLIAHGGSQGGWQALVTAALNPAVTAVAAEVPAGCNQQGKAAGRASTWPHWAKFPEPGLDVAKLLSEARYYDTVNFAARIKCPALVGVGLRDTTCAPEGIIEAYNRITSPKQLIIMPRNGHNDLPRPYDKIHDAFMEQHKQGEGKPISLR